MWKIDNLLYFYFAQVTKFLSLKILAQLWINLTPSTSLIMKFENWMASLFSKD